MKNKILKRLLVLATVVVLLPFTAKSIKAADEQTGVIKSIFNADQTRESAITIGVNRPMGQNDNVGEIVLEEGQTITDKGFINKFVTDEPLRGTMEYGTNTFSTSIDGYYFDGVYHDIANNIDVGYTKYVNDDYISAYAINYDLNTNTGGKEISYSFTGKKSTEGKYIYLYFHYTLNGKTKSGLEIESLGYLGYKIKVIPKSSTPQPTNTYGGYVKYDANGGSYHGETIYSDLENRQTSSRWFSTLNIPIRSDKPTRDGYDFAFWINPDNYATTKAVYAGTQEEVDLKKYPDIKESDITLSTGVLANNPDGTRTLKAVWDKNYSVVYDPNGGDSTPDSQTGNFGLVFSNSTIDPNTDDKTVNLRPAITRTGYVFAGWKDSETGTIYQPNDAYAVTYANPNRKLIAQWDPIYGAYLQYDANGGTIKNAPTYQDTDDRQTSVKVKEDKNISIITEQPVRAGYNFVFWVNPDTYATNHDVYTTDASVVDRYPEISSANVKSSYSIMTDMPDAVGNLKAIWDKPYQVTYDPNGGDSKPEDQSGNFGITVTPTAIDPNTGDKTVNLRPAITRKGYTFVGWTDEDGKLYKPNDAFTVTYDRPIRKLTANWKQIEKTTYWRIKDTTTNLKDPFISVEYGKSVDTIEKDGKTYIKVGESLDSDKNITTYYYKLQEPSPVKPEVPSEPNNNNNKPNTPEQNNSTQNSNNAKLSRPNTGDTKTSLGYVLLLVVAGAILTVVFYSRKKFKK